MNSVFNNKIITLITGLFVTAIIGFFLVRTVSEYDIWYHMAMGQEIIRNRSLPATDHLSLLNYGRPIHAHLWLFQSLAAAGYRFIGFWWLQLVQVVVWGLALLFVYRSTRLWTNNTQAWLLLLVTTIACSERFTIRPEIVSYMTLSIFYWRLQQKKYRSYVEIAIFFFLQEIWTNSHGLFILGPFFVGCYLIEALIGLRREKNYVKLRSLGILFAAVVLACIATPIGFENLKYTWLLIMEVSPASSSLFKSVFELAPPFGELSRQQISFWFFLFIFSGFMITLSAMVLTRRRELPVARTLVVCAMFITSLSGIRNMPLFAIVATPLMAEYLSLIGSTRIRNACKAAIAAVVLVSALFWSPLPAINFLTTWVPYRFGLGLSPDYVPLGLPAFLDKIGYSGNIFNSQVYGGFYEYHGSPARIPFYDYRLEDYDPNELQGVYEAVTLANKKPAAWNKLKHQYDFSGILLEHDKRGIEPEGLLTQISVDPEWQLVFLDHAASFWLREGYAKATPEVTCATVRILINKVSNIFQAENIDYFLDKTNRCPELRLEFIEQSVRRWDNPLFIMKLGLLKMQSGNMVESEQLFLRLLGKNPKSSEALTTLAQIAMYRGDTGKAELYIRKAISYYPSDTDLRQNLVDILKFSK